MSLVERFSERDGRGLAPRLAWLDEANEPHAPRLVCELDCDQPAAYALTRHCPHCLWDADAGVICGQHLSHLPSRRCASCGEPHTRVNVTPLPEDTPLRRLLATAPEHLTRHLGSGGP